jgi:hypothetical protein
MLGKTLAACWSRGCGMRRRTTRPVAAKRALLIEPFEDRMVSSASMFDHPGFGPTYTGGLPKQDSSSV